MIAKNQKRKLNRVEKLSKKLKPEEINYVNEENVINLLSEAQICKLCTLNFVSRNKKSLDDIFRSYELNIHEQQPAAEQHCYLCLGILEEHNLWNVAKTIAEKLADCNTSTFSIGVIVPKSVFLHRIAIIPYINEKLADEFGVNIAGMVMVKNVAKHFLSKLITNFSKKTLISDSELFVEVKYMNSNDQDGLAQIDSVMTGNKKRKESFSSRVSNLKSSDIKEYSPDCLVDNSTFEIQVLHSNIYLMGRYNKYCRSIRDMSARKLISVKLKELTNSTSVRLFMKGIEDYDVKILGNGKPFFIELNTPKLSNMEEQYIDKYMKDINSLETVSVSNLVKADKFAYNSVKNSSCVITYLAKLSTSTDILNDEDVLRLNEMKGMSVDQAVPIRLLDSEPFDTNQVCIHEMDLKREAGDFYELTIKVSGGCHVKEFIHGDLGRTEPSLKSILGVSFEILQLDLTNFSG